jgi:hypothetical protein
VIIEEALEPLRNAYPVSRLNRPEGLRARAPILPALI